MDTLKENGIIHLVCMKRESIVCNMLDCLLNIVHSVAFHKKQDSFHIPDLVWFDVCKIWKVDSGKQSAQSDFFFNWEKSVRSADCGNRKIRILLAK